jgi:hypothetical protein
MLSAGTLNNSRRGHRGTTNHSALEDLFTLD